MDFRQKGHMYRKSWKIDIQPAKSDVISISLSHTEEDLVLATTNNEILFLEVDAVLHHIEISGKLAEALDPDEVSV